MNDKKQIRSWVMYDWANSAFATTILAAVLPVYYQSVAAKDLAGGLATSYWGYTTSIAMIIVAVLAPILGAVADHSNSRKTFFMRFAILGIFGTALLFFVGYGNYLMASLFFIIGSIGFSGANIFYDSFLPIIVSKDKIDFTSSLGYAMGYLGGGILLAINLIVIMKPELFGITDPLLPSKLAFLSVAVWWFIFSVPAFKNMPGGVNLVEKPHVSKYLSIGITELKSTLKNIHEYSELFKFLIAFWFFNDGIGTIMRMATIYGADIGIGSTDLIGALLLTQFIGIPFSIIFGKLGEKIGAKRGVLLALGIYLIIVMRGYFLATATDFWILAAMVGLVQGGAQALSRSLYGSMVPKEKTTEFFGFLGVSSKFSAFMGPFLFALVGQLTGSSRLAIVSVAMFFVIGITLLLRVDVKKGMRQAQEADAKVQA